MTTAAKFQNELLCLGKFLPMLAGIERVRDQRQALINKEFAGDPFCGKCDRALNRLERDTDQQIRTAAKRSGFSGIAAAKKAMASANDYLRYCE